jgi:hypothetical protein
MPTQHHHPLNKIYPTGEGPGVTEDQLPYFQDWADIMQPHTPYPGTTDLTAPSAPSGGRLPSSSRGGRISRSRRATRQVRFRMFGKLAR